MDEVATAIGQYNLDGAYEFETYTYPGPSRAGRKPKSTDANAGRDLFARVSGGPQNSSNKNSNGRLRESDQPSSRDQGFSFKGAGAGKAEPSFSILGASESNNTNNRERGANLAKELFLTEPATPAAGLRRRTEAGTCSTAASRGARGSVRRICSRGMGAWRGMATECRLEAACFLLARDTERMRERGRET